MKALVGAFNQEKALVGAFSVIVQPVVEPMDHFTALVLIVTPEPEPSGGRGVFLVAGGGGGRTDPDISRYNWLPASAPLPQLPAPLAAVTLPS